MNQTQHDRYACRQHAFIRSRESVTRLRAGLIEWMTELEPTHYLTINFHADYSMVKAEEHMNQWYDFVHRRLYGACPEMLAEEKRIKLLGYPEYTLGEHIHYHCFVHIPLKKADWFCKIAEAKWKRIVKTGSLHIRPFQPTDEAMERAAKYSTKSSSSEEWYVPERQIPDQKERVLH